MKAQSRLKNLRRQYEQLLIACELYRQAAERRVARGQIREHTLADIVRIREDLAALIGLVRELPPLPPEEPLERALYGPLLRIRSALKPLYDRIEALPELAPDEPVALPPIPPPQIKDAPAPTAPSIH